MLQLEYSTPPPLPLDKMAELMDKGLKKSISAMGKDGVLIIGNTGAGKSTLVNYLLGYKMIETDRDGTDVYITEGSGGAVIGHSNSISETLFPQTFENSFDKVVYGDCPGFGENRFEEERICVQALTEIIVKSFRSIRSIVIVISLADLQASRGETFTKLCETLGELFRSPDKLKDSLIFVLTKVSKQDTEKKVHARLSKMLSDELSYLDSYFNSLKNLVQHYLPGNGNDEAKQKIQDANKKIAATRMNTINILNLLLGHPLILVNLEEQQTKKTILDRIQKSQPLTVEQFNFKENSDSRNKFNEWVYDGANEGRNCFRQLEISIHDMKEIEIQEKTLLSNVQSDLKNFFQKKEQQLKQYQSKLQEQIQQINTDEPVLYWEDELQAPWQYKYFWKSFISFGFWKSKDTKQFKYDGIEFQKVIEQKTNGKFKHTLKQEEEGKYQTTFRYEQNNDATAKIEIYISKKNRPDNRKLIPQLTAEKVVNLTHQDENKDQALTFSLISQENQDNINAEIQKLLEGLDADIDKEKYQKQLQEIKIAKIVYPRKIDEFRNEIQQNRQLFQNVRQIANIMTFESQLMKNFCDLAKQYLE